MSPLETERAVERICRAIDKRVAAGFSVGEAFASMPAGLGGEQIDALKLYYHLTRETAEGARIRGVMDAKVAELRGLRPMAVTDPDYLEG